MDLNQALAQLQQTLNHLQQQGDTLRTLGILLTGASMIIWACVVYAFYSRLADIARELREIRIAYQMELDRRRTTDESQDTE